MCHALLAFASKESEMTTITNKKQYPSEQYLNELITNIEFAARAPVEVVSEPPRESWRLNSLRKR